MGPDTSGLWIIVKDGTDAPLGAGILQRALNAAGIKNRAEFDPSLPTPKEDFFLNIGSK